MSTAQTPPLEQLLEQLKQVPASMQERYFRRLINSEEQADTDKSKLAHQLFQLWQSADSHVRTLTATLEQCKESIDELESIVKDLTRKPHRVGTVIKAVENDYLVAMGSQRQVIEKSDELVDETLEAGELVETTSDGNVILKRLPCDPTGRVSKVLGQEGDQLLIDYLPDQPLAVDVGCLVAAEMPKEGDKVLYDEVGRIALRVVQRQQTAGSDGDACDEVSWQEIGGLDQQIEEMRTTIESRFLYRDLAEQLGLNAINGMLLEGPPGTGKNMLVQALVTWLRRDKGRLVTFRNVAPGSWRDPFYGVSETKVVEPLRQAKRAIEDSDADMAVLFYDELDTLGSRSADTTNRIDSRVLTALLHELDGLAKRNDVLVIGATNRADLLDEALLRPGRFGGLILPVPRPDRDGARVVLTRHLSGNVAFLDAGIPPEQSVQACVDAATGCLYRDADPQDALVELVMQGGQRRPVWPRDVISGALLANIVQRAKHLALQRSLHGPLGLVPDDFAEAAEQQLDELAARLSDANKVREVLGDRQLPVGRVEPVRLS